MTNPIPHGFHTVVPTLMVKGAAEAIALYANAFSATEDYRMLLPNSDKIMHACIQLGDSKIFLGDSNPECGGDTADSRFFLYVPDVDVTHAQALKAGMTQVMPPDDMFWGDRMSCVRDRFGIQWSIATHMRDLSPEEIEQGQKEFLATMAKPRTA